MLRDSRGDEIYANAVTLFLALSIDRLAQTNNTLVRWLVRKTGTSKGTPAFDRQTVSMVWEFSEGNVFGKSVGSWEAALHNTLSALACLPHNALPGKATQCEPPPRFLLPVLRSDRPIHPIMTTSVMAISQIFRTYGSADQWAKCFLIFSEQFLLPRPLN